MTLDTNPVTFAAKWALFTWSTYWLIGRLPFKWARERPQPTPAVAVLRGLMFAIIFRVRWWDYKG